MKRFLLIPLFLSTSIFALNPEPRTMPKGGIDKPLMGQILFFDKTLSMHGTQNCASCHNPDTAFVDLRENSAQQMVSQGDDPNKFGNRNAPTLLYAKYIPDFHFDESRQEYVGGQFWDGRAKNLAEQAGFPPIDPNEMGLPNKQTLAQRLYLNPMYRQLFTQFYSEQVWQSVEKVYSAMEDALATFQQEKKLLAPFDSNYDKFLQGTYRLSDAEERGRALFFDKNRTNCSQCHQSQAANSPEETFSDYRYYNLGVPSNRKLITHNKLENDFVDYGLFQNPQVKGDEQQKGKFRTPTLRNVAVTAPYFHNGVFKELRTVLLFLDSYNNPTRAINPETNKRWEQAEFAPTIIHPKLQAKPLTDQEIDSLEAFLKTLTDERYLPLVK